MGKSQREKGLRIEREIVNKLRAFGVPAERVPLSGAAGGSYTGDLLVSGEKAEVKGRKDGTGFALLYRWIEGVKYLIVKTDREQPLVVMELDQFASILNGDSKVHSEKGDSW
jgi:hypothetical protein|tara:strand:- start:700 stop:1035 length:336 start_codon:yes stop_codon:yes gene_type:complete